MLSFNTTKDMIKHLAGNELWYNYIMTVIGTCKDEQLVEDIFGSVSEFARLVEEYGDWFEMDGLYVEYDEETDVHTFLEQ